MKKFYSTKSFQILHRIGITVITAISVMGCASTPAPTERMIIARAAISNASSAGGGEFAPLQLKSAMEKMDIAEQAMAEKDYVRALQLAEQAQADAQLSGAMAGSVKAKKAADALQEDSRVLRAEMSILTP